MNEKPEIPALCRAHQQRFATEKMSYGDGELVSDDVTYACGCTASAQYCGAPIEWVLRENITLDWSQPTAT